MSFPRYPEYKDSGVEWLGDAPTHWEVRRYKDVFTEREERSTAGDETLLSVSAYTGVSPRSEIIDEGDHLSRAESLEGYKVCYPNDLVMNIMLAWNRGLGFSEQHGIVSPAYSVFRLKKQDDPRFLDYLVRADPTTRYFKAFSAGVIDSRLRLYPDVFLGLKCALPSPGEQSEIANFLDREIVKIDALIAEQERLIALLKEKRQVVISDAVTKGLSPDAPMKDSGIKWLGEVPAHWLICRVKHLAKIISKGTTPTTIGSEFVAEGIRFLKAENIYEGRVMHAPESYIDESTHLGLSRSILEPGDVLVVIAGATTGKSAVLQADFLPCNTNQAVAFIRPTNPRHCNLIQRWLSSSFVQAIIRLASVQSAQPNLSMEDLGNLYIPVPGCDEELDGIDQFLTDVVSRLDSLVTEAMGTIGLLRERRSALISAAVTGKIDVRKAA